ncbi:hypothetical protein [Paracoccus denitrificans]|uniref:hypothetical protein n=1 Tax=Paracoccus denitrificans TaxID=266 RepID=UPI00131A244A|nr:hypothetical protein [Paracoccus denitrificans]
MPVTAGRLEDDRRKRLATPRDRSRNGGPNPRRRIRQMPADAKDTLAGPITLIRHIPDCLRIAQIAYMAGADTYLACMMRSPCPAAD